MNTYELRKQIELNGAESTVKHLTDCLDKGDLKPDDFSVRVLADAFFPGGMPQVGKESVLLHHFAHLFAAIAEAKIKAIGQSDMFFSSLVQTIPVKSTQKTRIYRGGYAETLPDTSFLAISQVQASSNDFSDFPDSAKNFHLNYIETPPTEKHRKIVSIVREMLFSDYAEATMEAVVSAGEGLAVDREKRMIDVILGVTNTYQQNGIARNTYYPGASSHPWKNQLSDNELLTGQNIEAALGLFCEFTCPITTLPLHPSPYSVPNTVLVMPPKYHGACQLFQGTPYQVKTSPLAFQRLKAIQNVANPEKIWFIGDFSRAFASMENWGLTVEKQSPSDETDLKYDIVMRLSVSQRSTPAVINPRYVVKCTG